MPARDQKPLLQFTLKKSGHVVEPRPNAPLLIRIVRYPFRLAGALLFLALALGLLFGAALVRSRRRSQQTPLEAVSLRLDSRS